MRRRHDGWMNFLGMVLWFEHDCDDGMAWLLLRLGIGNAVMIWLVHVWVVHEKALDGMALGNL
jgi:hypothetical protein